MKDLIDNKSQQELLQTVLAETAKARNEMACAQRDIDKAQSRLNFLLVLANNLINRNKDQ